MADWKRIPVYFDGHDLSPYLQVTNIDRGIGPSRSNNLLKAGNQKGKQFSSYTYDEKVIPMDFNVVMDLISKRRELAKILNVSEPKRLVFGDELDKYYMAIPDGDIGLNEAFHIGTGSLDWIIPDGVAYSVDLKEFKPITQAPNEIRCKNDGSENVKPLLEAVMASENGFVAFIDNHGSVLQFGNAEETDGRSFQVSEKKIDESMRTQGKWQINEGAIRYRTMYNKGLIPNVISGTYKFAQGNFKENAIPQFATNNTESWDGPTLYQPISPNTNGSNSGNFEMKCRFGFNKNIIGRKRYEFNIMGEDNNKIPFAFVIRDSSYRRAEMRIEVWAYDNMIYQEDVTKKFKKSFFEVKIARFGNNVKYTLSEIAKLTGNVVKPGAIWTKTFTRPEFGTQKALGITLWSYRYRNSPTGDNFGFTDFKFFWHNVDKWEDVPNLFENGDILWIDTNSAKIYLNGVETPQLETFGNEWESFRIEPGEEFVFTTESSWIDAIPAYTVRFREVWL